MTDPLPQGPGAEDFSMRSRGSALAYGSGGAAAIATLLLGPEWHVNKVAMGCLAAASVGLAIVSYRSSRRQGEMPGWFQPHILGPLVGALSMIFSGEAATAFALMFVWGSFLAAMWGPKRNFYPEVIGAIAVVSGISLVTGAVPLVFLLMIDFMILGLVPYIRALVLQIEMLSRTDQLTGLANRRAFYENLSQAIKETHRFRQKAALLIIDIDHFKRLNDEHGHLEGDRFLREASRAWQMQLRTTDLLARFGGEEFVALLRDSDLEAARECADRIRKATPSQTTCSIGIAELQDVDTIDRLISRADAALYEAKDSGRNRTVVAKLAYAS